ncbi:hypothetical protein JL720_13901 [Aureococcus anophagefferens]|nr:hypothetical protein JL720_13901 [Aureococcus anophagefferens]
MARRSQRAVDLKPTFRTVDLPPVADAVAFADLDAVARRDFEQLRAQLEEAHALILCGAGASAGLIAYLFTQTMREELVWPEDGKWAQVNRILKPLAAALVAYREAPNPQGHFYSTVGNVMPDRAVIVTLNVDGLAASSGLPVHEVHGVLAPWSPDGHEVTTTREQYQELLAVADGPVVDGAGNQLAPKVALYDNTQFKRNPFDFDRTNPFSEIAGTPKVLIIVGLSGDTEMVELMIKESKTAGITKIYVVDRENHIPPDLLKAFNDLPHRKQRIIHCRTTADAFASYLEAAAPSLDG